MAINNQVVKDYTTKLYLEEEVKEVNSNLKETYSLLRDYEINIHNLFVRLNFPLEVANKIL